MRCDLGRLPDALADHATLTSVDLTSLRMEDGALAAIATALPRNHSLVSLNLHTPVRTAEALAADASIRLVLDRNRSSAAERAAGGVSREGRWYGYGTGSSFGMPARSDLFKEASPFPHVHMPCTCTCHARAHATHVHMPCTCTCHARAHAMHVHGCLTHPPRAPAMHVHRWSDQPTSRSLRSFPTSPCHLHGLRHAPARRRRGHARHSAYSPPVQLDQSRPLP